MKTDRVSFLSLFIIFIIIIIQFPIALAQSTKTKTPSYSSVNIQDQELQEIKTQVKELTKATKTNKSDDNDLTKIKLQADDLSRKISNIISEYHTRLDEIRNRLVELGNPTENPQQPEPSIVVAERSNLISQRAQKTAFLSEADALYNTVDQISKDITEQRNQLFKETLFSRNNVSFSLIEESVSSLWEEISSSFMTFITWALFVWKEKIKYFMIVFGSSLAAAFLFLLGISKLFGIHTKQKKMINDPSYIDRLIFALHSTIISSASFSIFLVSFLLFIQELDIITGDLIPITSITFSLIGFIYFCWKLIISILSPSLPQWRLVPISNKGSDWLLIYALILVIVSSFDYYFEMISTKSNSIIALNSFSALITGLTLIAISFLKPISDRKDAPETPGKAWPYIIIIAIRSVSIFLIIATLSGYIGLAHFVSKQIVITSSVLIIMYIGVLAGKSISKEGNFAETRIGRSLINNFHLGQVSIDQIGLAAGLGIDVLAIIISIPLILLSLGFSPDDLQNWIYHLFTEIRIGNIRISLLGILAGIAIFCFGLLITRWAQRWLDKNIMARSQTDIGVRNSVEMGVGYLGYAIAAIIGISAAGINLSSLALVASALSLGIGFGLQTIVSNFVSGLILLIERPFKVGDWIVSGTTEGIVRRISVRATEIETFQHQSIIVPNSQFINISVGNWTHRNTLGRIDISLSTPITPTDPDKVMKIMQEVAVNNPLVLRNPPPIIIFSDIQQNSFLFELRVNVANILSGTKVRNELRVSLVENLRKGKIVPFVIAPDDELTKLRKQAYASFPEVMQNGTSNLIFTDTEQQ